VNVNVNVNVIHMAAPPNNLAVKAVATYEEMLGKLLEFEVELYV
jgi:predicted thioesterase